jgi:hypothetical protein
MIHRYIDGYKET